MPSQLVSSSGCCQPCDSEPIVVNIPGPQGAPGTNGTNGTDGIDSFTYTTAPFFVPALGANVVITVDNSSFLPESIQGQFFVSVQGCGYMQVLDVVGLTVTLRNPATGILGIPNAIPTTLIPQGSLITLAGAVGPQGAAGASGGAPVGASYICRSGDGTLTNETALDLLTAGYMKTAGSGGAGVISTVSTVPVGDISGTLPVSKGGTGQALAPAGNEVISGDGASNTVYKEITGTLPIVVTAGASTINLSAPSIVPFSYVTFTRRVSSLNPSTPLLAAGVTANPYNTTVFSGAGITYTGFDTDSAFSAATGRFTCPYAGSYRIDAYFNFTGSGGTARVTVSIRKTGSDVITSKTFDVSSSGYHPISILYLDQAIIGEYYEVYVNTTSNGVYVDQGSSFSVQRIQA